MTGSINSIKISLPTPFPVSDINAYLITDDPLTLVDCGVHSSMSLEALTQGIRAAGFAVEDIERIILTHAHLDHAGAAARVSQMARATVLMHPRAYPLLYRTEDNMERYRQLFSQCGIPSAILEGWEQSRTVWKKLGHRDEALYDMQLVNDNDLIPFEHGNLRVLHTPGHCPDHISLVDDNARVTHSGDHLLPGITPNPLAYFDEENNGRRYRSLPDYLASMDRMEALQLVRALPGHGDIIEDIPAVMENNRRRIFKRREDFRELLQQGGHNTVYDLARAHFGDMHPMQTYLTVTEALGALDLLAQQDALVLDEESDLIRFTLKPEG